MRNRQKAQQPLSVSPRMESLLSLVRRSRDDISAAAMPETVAMYIARLRVRMRSQHDHASMNAITKAHQAAGFSDSPSTTKHFIVGETMKGIARTLAQLNSAKIHF